MPTCLRESHKSQALNQSPLAAGSSGLDPCRRLQVGLLLSSLATGIERQSRSQVGLPAASQTPNDRDPEEARIVPHERTRPRGLLALGGGGVVCLFCEGVEQLQGGLSSRACRASGVDQSRLGSREEAWGRNVRSRPLPQWQVPACKCPRRVAAWAMVGRIALCTAVPNAKSEGALGEKEAGLRAPSPCSPQLSSTNPAGPGP